MPLRLTLLVDTPARRAHGNSASRLALGLAESGRVETTILCYSEDPAPAWLPPEVRVKRIGVTRASRSLPGLVRYLTAERPDVLISRQVHANLVALAASRVARARSWPGKLIIGHDHPIELSHASNWRDNKWAAKVGYRFADAHISNSPSVRQNIISWCRLDPSSVAVVPPPIPAFLGLRGPSPHSWLTDGGPPVFVHTSNMTPWKRLDLLIDAFADVCMQKEARLLILGDGPGRLDAAARIRQLGLTGVAQTVGWVSDPLQFAARAWAFVLPSDEEGFAQVLTEAMSAGCPVISTDAQGGGPRFVTCEGACGLLVPRGDRAGLCSAMLHVLDPGVRSRYAELGLRRAGELSPIASATKLLDFISERLSL